MKKIVLMLMAMVVFGNLAASSSGAGSVPQKYVRAVFMDKNHVFVQVWDGQSLATLDYLYVDKDVNGDYKSSVALLINAMNNKSQVVFYISPSIRKFEYVNGTYLSDGTNDIQFKHIDNMWCYAPGL